MSIVTKRELDEPRPITNTNENPFPVKEESQEDGSRFDDIASKRQNGINDNDDIQEESDNA